VLVTLDIVQHEHGAGAGRQLRDRRLQIHAEVDVLGARRRRHLQHGLAIAEEPLAGRAERAKALDDHVHGQPVEPRRERRLAAKQRELLPRADKDVLREFIGCFGSGHPPREVENPRHVGPVDPFESGRLSLSSKDDVFHRH